MGIRNRIFFVTAGAMLSMLFLSYAVMYFYFYHAMFEETVIKQRANVELNRQMADNFVQSVYHTAVQVVSDKALGRYLSADSKDPMEIFQARAAIKSQFSHYSTHQVIDSTYNYCNTLFLSDVIPIAEAFETYTLSDNPYTASNFVFSNKRVKEEEWYQKAVDNFFYTFVNEETDEFCIARKIINTYYLGPDDNEETAVMVVSVARNQLEKVFASIPVTKGSGYAVLDEDGNILYCSDSEIGAKIYESAWQEYSREKKQEFTISLPQGRYLSSLCEAQGGMRLLFLTPNQDIVDAVVPLMRTYSAVFAAIAMIALILIYFLSGRLTRPLIQMSGAIAGIGDTRQFDKNRLHVSEEKELVILEKSFNKLIDNVNGLIEDISVQKEREKRSQLRALQAQINPHFIFNAMDMVNWLALSRNCDDIANIVSSIANMMRYSITDADGMVPIEQEIANIREFTTIYQQRHNSCPILETRIEASDIYIPKFTLQPLVENAIRHAKPGNGENLVIQVWARKEEGKAVIEVHDNGRGCDAEELNRHLRYEQTGLLVSSGFGIRNVNERIGLWFCQDSGLSYYNEANQSLTGKIVLSMNPEKSRNLKREGDAV